MTKFPILIQTSITLKNLMNEHARLDNIHILRTKIAWFLLIKLGRKEYDKKWYLVVMYPSLGSARFGSVLARAFGQKARLGSARSISQKARLEQIHKNEPI